VYADNHRGAARCRLSRQRPLSIHTVQGLSLRKQPYSSFWSFTARELFFVPAELVQSSCFRHPLRRFRRNSSVWQGNPDAPVPEKTVAERPMPACVRGMRDSRAPARCGPICRIYSPRPLWGRCRMHSHFLRRSALWQGPHAALRCSVTTPFLLAGPTDNASMPVSLDRGAWSV
jgi:hypothetical protein